MGVGADAPMNELARLNLNALVALEAAARHCNLTRAGKECSVTPSAISQRIAKLEARLGIRIFERFGGNGLCLTPIGEVYVGRIRRALEYIEAAGIEAKEK